MNKKLITILGICCILSARTTKLKAQQNSPLTIEQCYQLALKNYPLVKQKELIEKTTQYTIENAATGNLPQFSLNGQSTYQSDVTKIPIEIPGKTIPSLSKDQYKIYAEVTQNIYDGGIINEQKKLQEANEEIQSTALQVNLYQIKSRINDLFFGILLLNEQIQQNKLHISDIQLGLDKMKAMISNGTALKSNGDLLKAALLTAGQTTITIQSTRNSYLNMLGLFIHQSLDSSTQFLKPEPPAIEQQINRPELSYYAAQDQLLNVQKQMLSAQNKPKLLFFLQGGYGRPGLNMLSNSFDPYYIGGLRINIPLNGFYTTKKQQAIIALNQRDIELQKETFLFNTKFIITAQSTAIDKYQALLASDDQIIHLRTSIKNTAYVQLENGVLTTNDFLQEVNGENEARQNKIIHEINHLEQAYNQRTTIGQATAPN